MLETTAGRLAQLCEAELVGDPVIRVGPDVVIDSRAVTPGCLFVALPGEHADGHDFAVAAVAAGAAAVLVTRRLPLTVPQLVVSDAAAGLARLATAVVAAAVAAGVAVVGITGSSGKTSTKDLVAQLLAELGPTVAPAGSLNNEIGVPLTAVRVGSDTRFLVSELGARGLGHIRWLCGVVPPRIGVVVNVGEAHLGEFGSQQAIAQAKGELVEELPSDGWAVLNALDPNVAAMTGRTRARIAAFAAGSEPEIGELRVWSTEATADELQRPRFTLNAAGIVSGAAPVALRVSGGHQIENALAAATVALACGAGVAEVARGLGRAEARSKWRMELGTRPDGALVVNDTYNANPSSMAAALRSLVGLRRPGGRLAAILGDMRELGDSASERHRWVGELAGRLGLDHLIALGDHAGELAAGAAAGGLAAVVAGSREEAVALASAWLRPTDVVLVKASRGLALETVAEQLLLGRAQAGAPEEAR